MCYTLGLDIDKVHFVSARTGKNVAKLLDAVIKEIPPPK